MKKITYTLIACFLFLLPVFALADDIPAKVISGLKNGDTEEIAEYFNKNIELVILDKENICSKAQAKQILNDFFKKNSPSDFKLIHQGGNDSASYAVGNYKSGNNKYRVYLLLKKSNGKPLIHQLRIER